MLCGHSGHTWSILMDPPLSRKGGPPLPPARLNKGARPWKAGHREPLGALRAKAGVVAWETLARPWGSGKPVL